MTLLQRFPLWDYLISKRPFWKNKIGFVKIMCMMYLAGCTIACYICIPEKLNE
jgi:hypothetical protein